MRFRYLLLMISAALTSYAQSAGPMPRASDEAAKATSNLKALYDEHHWFALRDAVIRGSVPAFYRSAVQSAFNQTQTAERDLGAVISQAPHSADAYEARELLATMYLRQGSYHKAILQLQAMLSERPGSADVKNAISLYGTLSQTDQDTVGMKPSTLTMVREDDSLFLPIMVNGRTATYAFDTGANFNGISETEALRLGMKMATTDSQVEDSSGNHLGLRVAIATDLRIGGLHLRNVAFGVFPDAQPPFNGLPQTRRGLIGIPVLLAMRAFRWSQDGTFAFGFSSKPFHLDSANLAFEQSFPVTMASFQGSGIEMTVDSGAQRTVFSPPFARTFSNVLKPLARPETYRLTGVGGSASYDSMLVPFLELQIGGHNVTLKPAHILTKESSNESQWAAGNLGIDLLNQVHSTTFDFGAMTLTLK